jgi:MSHA biogenesis protein MshQ
MTCPRSSLLHGLALRPKPSLSCRVLCPPPARRWLRQSVVMLSLLLAGFSAHSLDYIFGGPDQNLPIVCVEAAGEGNYQCGALTLAAGETISIGDPKPATITFTGAFTSGAGNTINLAGSTADLFLVVDGAVTLGAGTSLVGNLTTLNAGAVTIGGDSFISGDLITDTGFLTIGAATVPPPAGAPPQTGVGGSVSTQTGYISMGAGSVINGSATTELAGYVVLGAGAEIGGPIVTLGAGYVVLGANAKVGGSITVGGLTGADYVTTGVGSTVAGNISTAGSYIVLGADTVVSGSISTQNSYITIGADAIVTGEISTNDPTSAITLGLSSEVFSICCNNGAGDTCLVDGSGGTTPAPLVCAGVSVVAAGFACLEPGTNAPWDAAVRQPLYTKLVGTNFTLDIGALKTGDTLEDKYAETVTVELVDGSGDTACASRTEIASASQTLSFTDADGGRKSTADMVVNKAYASLRCRVSDANQTPSVVACSTDSFAVRPRVFVVSSPNANADSSGVSTTALPMIKAVAAFSLSATSAAGYNGTPLLDISALQAHSDAITNGSLSGSLGTSDATTGIAEGDFTYSEVGYFRLNAGSLTDTIFTTVDQSADCTDDFSNTLVGGKYGCKFGNSDASDYFGRFIPDHFEVVVVQGCTAGDFTYSAQPFTTIIRARNGLTSPAITVNYHGLAPPYFANSVTLSEADTLTTGGLTLTTLTASEFSMGMANPTPAFTFASQATAPVMIRLHAADSDNVSSSGYETAATTTIRSGRVRLLNAFGSEILDLPMIMRSEYWQSEASGWQPNTADSCSNASLAFSAVTTPDITGNTCVWDTGTATGNSANGCGGTPPNGKQYKEVGVAGFAGDFNLWLKAPGPGNAGSIDVIASVPDWLQYNWTGAAANPIGRTTFGVYKSKSDKVIHRRERY